MHLYFIIKQQIFTHPIKVFAFLSLILFFDWYYNCLPEKFPEKPCSTVLLDRNGKLLGAKIANDGQWRFKEEEDIPEKFKVCLLEFEDRNFYKHHGVSIRAIGRAILKNIQRKKIVNGGSTISMQSIRIIRNNPKRTYYEKIIEMFTATRLEQKFSKEEILRFYISNAPFGNNVVGLEAASWRYYGRDASKLSWSECATLAVLPNSPGLIYPGKNHQKLLHKRNRILKRLLEIQKIDSLTYDLSLQEPLPAKPLPLPQHSPHLLQKCISDGLGGNTIKTSIDVNLQLKIKQQLAKHNDILKENRIFNGAVIISSVKSGEILAYVGNTEENENSHSNNVDCIMANRSTGSILKPILYIKALESGDITPKQLLADIPLQMGGFSPKNFSKQYDGAVPANQALSRSLNIPMVQLLQNYGLEKFYFDLKNLGFTTLSKPAKHYGLSLILGGGEVKLYEINQVYNSLAQKLESNTCKPVQFLQNKKNDKPINLKLNRACIYTGFEAMVEVNRPDEDGNWKLFNSSQKIAWKTGTSFGFRDAWAVGITPDFVVSVWIGNADGEGRPGLTGIKAAGPLLFDVFGQLPKSVSWFHKPISEFYSAAICSESGLIASEMCQHIDSVLIPKTCAQTIACNYHQIIHLDKTGKFRVDCDCEDISNIQNVSYFVMPPMMERFYKLNHPNYKAIPEYRSDCKSKATDRSMAIIYPKNHSIIYVPIEIDGKLGKTIFEATHRNPQIKIFWHLDEEYLGETREIHQLILNPEIGKHKLTLVDENGNTSIVKFEVVGKN